MKLTSRVHIIKDLGIIVFCAVIFFTIKLSQNEPDKPWQLSKIFSVQNIKETSIQLLAIAVIVVPLRMIYLKATKRTTK